MTDLTRERLAELRAVAVAARDKDRGGEDVTIKKPRKYCRRVWGGFVDGRLDFRMIDTGFGGWGHSRMYALALYTEKKRAREEYEDVRPIEVREL